MLAPRPAIPWPVIGIGTAGEGCYVEERWGSVARKRRPGADSWEPGLPLVTFYTRRRCDLCDRAKMLLDILGAGTTFTVREIDVDEVGGQELSKYGERV